LWVIKLGRFHRVVAYLVVAAPLRRHPEPARGVREVEARGPRSARAAMSCARATISAVSKVLSYSICLPCGSHTSQTHRPGFLLRTPLYTGCLVLVSLNLVLPARRFGAADDTVMYKESFSWSQTTGESVPDEE
jgi:hypothetical protein